MKRQQHMMDGMNTAVFLKQEIVEKYSKVSVVLDGRFQSGLMKGI